MTLSEISKTAWFQRNLEVLRITSSPDERVKHIMALLAASQFKQCSETCELWLLASDAAKDLWRAGTPVAWLADAYSFATTVAVFTGAIIPPKPEGKKSHGAA
jgi:hypothetical protein